MSQTGTLFRNTGDNGIGGVVLTVTKKLVPPPPPPEENKWIKGNGVEIFTTPKKQS